jgi:purine-nucleoside phosphorylase
MYNNLVETKDFLATKIKKVPKTAIILGSGLGVFVESMEDTVAIPYEEIPHFHKPSVEGHAGQLVFGSVNGVDIVAMQGRYHVYEGYDLTDVVHPIRSLGLLGIKNVIITNASGGLNTSYRPGDLVCIKDHINMTGKNPLIGPNDDRIGPRFPDMTNTYNNELRDIAKNAAKELKFDLKEGVYCGLLGPTYETPAEIQMVRSIGGDLVGMSTVPEAIAANHMGLNILGIACVTNMAAGISDEKLDHADVKEVAQLATEKFSSLLTKVVERLG